MNLKHFNVIGVDVGGTFTDLIYVDKNNGSIEFAKVPTSSDNQAFGVMNAIQKAKLNLDLIKIKNKQVDVIYKTTLNIKTEEFIFWYNKKNWNKANKKS